MGRLFNYLVKRFFQRISLTIGFFVDSFFGKLSPLGRAREFNVSNLISIIITFISLAISLLVFGTIVPNLNQRAIGSSAMNLISTIPIILVAVTVLGLITAIFGVTFEK